MPPDPFAVAHPSRTSQATSWVAVVPDDNTDLALLPKALWCNTAGTVVLVGGDGHAESFTVLASQPLPFQPVRVKATGTTAGIVALY